MYKKIISFFTAALLFAAGWFAVLTANTVSAEVITDDGYSFDSETGTLTITSDNGSKTWRANANIGKTDVKTVVIESGVTALMESAFSNCSQLTSVTIPDSVTSIGESVFYACSSLASVKIPAGVTSVERSTFAACKSLTSVTIPDSVTSIGNSAFADCNSLTSVEIPDGVTSLGVSVFAGSGLTSVTIPKSVTSIESNAFANCFGLTSVTIPDSVASVNKYAFQNSYTIKQIIYPDGLDISEMVFLPNLAPDRIAYEISADGKVTVTDITPGSKTDTVTLPDKIDIGGTEYSVTEVNEDVRDLVSETGHTHITESEATCTEKAVCSICGEYGDEPAGHTGGTADCTQKAVCTVCGEEYGEISEHSFSSDWSADGTNHWHECENCDEIKDLAAHTVTADEAVAATCTQTGLTAGSHCSVCDKVIKGQTILAKLPHSYVDGVCSLCGTPDPGAAEETTAPEEETTTSSVTEDSSDETTAPEGETTTSPVTEDSSDETTAPEGETTSPTAEDSSDETTAPEGETTSPTAENSSDETTAPEGETTTSPVTENTAVTTVTSYTPTSPVTGRPSTGTGSGSSDRVPAAVIAYSTTAPQEQLFDALIGAADGSTVTVKLSGNTVVEKDVFEEIAGRNVTVKFMLDRSVYWTVNGKDIYAPRTVDMGVKLNSKAVSRTVTKQLSDGGSVVPFTLLHNGELGFKGVLHLPVKRYGGEYAALYRVEGENYEYVNFSRISDGCAEFGFEHASDYAAVIGDQAFEDVSAGAGMRSNADNSRSGMIPYIFCGAFVPAALLSAAVFRRKKIK
ncbi:MAG: leucine-rich repeat protein [Ruminococcus sp.]|nr:leucine-rich repeat protein [Ruminococcus sp.]